MCLVSVLMPAYNAANFLNEAIDSILNQSFKNFEFIIINDGSTDNTEEIILSYTDDRIKYYKNDLNIKLIPSLNKGLILARGKYIARMDADDISLPDRLQLQVDFMENNLDIGISGGQMDIFGIVKGKSDYPITHEECLIRLLDQTCFSNNLFIIRKELIEKHKLSFNNKYLHTEDYKFYIDALKYLKGKNLSETLTKYRQHENSVTAKNKLLTYNNRNLLRKEYLEQLVDLNKNEIEQVYGEIGYGKIKLLIKLRKELKIKYKTVSINYIDDTIFKKIWYKDALYQSETDHLIVFKYAYLFLYKINIEFIKNWINLMKHYLKYNLLNR